jgi:hypothetical protein
MYVNFPDRPRVRIDTFHIGRTMAGVYQTVSDEVAKEMGMPSFEERLRNTMISHGQHLWHEREKVTYLVLGKSQAGRHTVWAWLDHSVPFGDGDGSHAFLVFTCDPSEDQPLPSLVQQVIDQAELRWVDIAFDFEY